MKSFTDKTSQDLQPIRYILMDIDDTITTEGKLSYKAYEALWKAYEKGYHLIPVTGRPAGWCDLIIRQWPVKAVVGENGAFVYYFDDKELKTFIHPSVPEISVESRLKEVQDKVLKDIPNSRISKDQFARKYDLAIDFNEDPPYLGFEVAEQIKNICMSMGAEAKVSSIHVNTWFGNYNKVSMVKLFMESVLQEEDIQKKVIFFGDSPNDEPMFEYFPNSFGVANIKPFLGQIIYRPKFITSKESGEGFSEAIEYILGKINS